MAKLIDLSHAIEDGMVTYPGLPAPRISDHVGRDDSRDRFGPGTGIHIGKIEMVANTGTYLDTPAHFYSDGIGLADLPLERVADLPGVCVSAPGPAVGADVIDGLEIFGKTVLFATGWSRQWGTDEYGSPDSPYLTAGAVTALVDGGAALVGIDSVNIDDREDDLRPAHTGLLGAGIPIVEHLTGLEALVGASFRFFAVPVKVKGLGTFPVRAFAVVA
jgi:arylformamidase